MQNEGFMKNVFGFIFYPLSLEKRQFSSQFFFGSKRFFLSISITFLKKRKKIYTFANFHTHTLSWSLLTPPTNMQHILSLTRFIENWFHERCYQSDIPSRFHRYIFGIPLFFFPVFFFLFFFYIFLFHLCQIRSSILAWR